jgi:Domain of unknown function (DUF4389)
MRFEQQPRFHVEEPGAPRDRVLALARPILIIPHALLVGGPFVGLGGYRGAPVFGVLAATIAIFDWVAILVTGHPIAGLQELKRLYLRWRARLLAYGGFLRDEYPPFGEGPYPASLELPDEPPSRDRLTVALRLFMLVPHLLVLVGLMLAAAITVIISWLALIITGRLPHALWQFNRDVMAYVLRVETYGLLVHDEFPPFALEADDALAARQAQA